MKYAVVGTGALGSVVGSFPAMAGKEVWFLDPFEAHINAINENGLVVQKRSYSTVSDGFEEINVKVNATTSPEPIGKADVIIVLVKGMYTESSVENIKKIAKDDSIILTLQNGYGHTDILKKHFNLDNIAYGVSHIASGMVKPGVVRPNFPDGPDIVLGSENKQLKSRLEEVAADFNAGGCEAYYKDDIDVDIWEKLTVNCSVNATCGLVRLTARTAYSFQPFVDLGNEIIKEIIAVAEAKGIHLDPKKVIKLKNAVPVETSFIADHYPSTTQDIKAKKQTEIEFLNGAIVREGKKYGVPTPYNDAIYKLTYVLEKTYDKQF